MSLWAPGAVVSDVPLGAPRSVSHSWSSRDGSMGSDSCLVTAGKWWALGHCGPGSGAACTHPISGTLGAGEQWGLRRANACVAGRAGRVLNGREDSAERHVSWDHSRKVLGSRGQCQGGREQPCQGKAVHSGSALFLQPPSFLRHSWREGRAFAHFKDVSDLGEVTFLGTPHLRIE